MRAREIEKWLVKILDGGARDLVDAEVARHIVRVWELVEAIDQRFRPKDALEELRGNYKTPSEISVTLTMLEARARENNREWLIEREFDLAKARAAVEQVASCPLWATEEEAAA